MACVPSGTDALDPELTALSNESVPVAHKLFAYLQFGGAANYENALRFLSDHLLTTGFGFDRGPQPRYGVYHPDLPGMTPAEWHERRDKAGRRWACFFIDRISCPATPILSMR